METEIITIYVLGDDLLKTMGIREDVQIKMNNAEVITVVLTAAYFFCGHIENARNFPGEHGYIPDMLSGSRLNRRIHNISPSVWQNLSFIPGETFRRVNHGQEYITDSFPVPVCQNIRIGPFGDLQRRGLPGFYSVRTRLFLRSQSAHDRNR